MQRIAKFWRSGRAAKFIIIFSSSFLSCCLCVGTVNVMDSLGLIPTSTPTLTPTKTLLPTLTFTPTLTSLPTFTFTQTLTPTIRPTQTPFLTATLPAGCMAAYPDFCIQPGIRVPCTQLPSNFTVLPPDPLRYDGDGDGRGCEN